MTRTREPFDVTEDAIALQFSKFHADIRWCQDWSKWLVWYGTVWSIVEHDEAAANNILSPNAATVGGRSRPVVKTKIWQVAETNLPEGNREHRIFQNLFNDVGRIHVRAL